MSRSRRAIASDDPADPLGRPFWIGLAVGGALMGYAIAGAAAAFTPDERLGLLRWLVGAAIAHDALLAPAVTIVGLLLAWVLPSRVRGPVLGALAISAVVVLFSWPALRGYGRRDANPTILPHDAGRNVMIVVALVWLGAAIVVAGRLVRERRR